MLIDVTLLNLPSAQLCLFLSNTVVFPPNLVHLQPSPPPVAMLLKRSYFTAILLVKEAVLYLLSEMRRARHAVHKSFAKDAL